VELHGTSYRAIVIHYTAHDSRRQKKIAKSLDASQKKIAKELKGCLNEFACETDALRAIPSFEKASTALHSIKANIVPVSIRKRGRPPKGAPAPTRIIYKIEWEVTENKPEVDRLNKEAGCFVLITNAPCTGKMSLAIKDVLKTYKGQYGVESCFAFLKDPLITNDIFLKKPSRIDALGMVLVISLLVWRLMERSMRLYVEETGEAMPGLNKQRTKRPTSYMLTVHMGSIMVVYSPKGSRIFLRQPKKIQMIYLKALGLNETVFTDPKCRCRPKIPQKSRV
jgi:transposase